MNVPRLLYPACVQLKNTFARRQEGATARACVIAGVGVLFWGVVFFLFYRVLLYFHGIEVLGAVLAAKLLSMILLTFFSILTFSTMITAVSSLFMSEELQVIIASPFDRYELFHAKLCATILNSSWMVVLFGLPVFFSYGIVFAQGPAYYAMLGVTLPPFVLIAGCLGTGAALVLVSFFPARRLKDVLFLMSLLLVAGLYLLLRLIRPERLVDPDAFFTVFDFIASLDMPASPLLPSQWVADVLGNFLFQTHGSAGPRFQVLLLWSTASALVYLLSCVFARMYFDAWSRSQEGRTVRIAPGGVIDRTFVAVLQVLPPQVRAVLEKDIRLFFRDTAQWSQLLILSAIVVIYLYNFSVLPLDRSPIPTVQLQNLIAFLNLGLAGFVIAAVAVRFAFPAVSLEGQSCWFLMTAPLDVGRLLRSKFLLNAAVLVVLAELLTVCTNRLLYVEPFMMVLSTVTVALMVAALSGLAVGIGAIYPRFRYENVAQIPTGFGGLLYMIVAVLYIAAVVVCEALPVHTILMARLSGRALSVGDLAGAALAGAGVVVLSGLVCVVPLRMGIACLRAREQW